MRFVYQYKTSDGERHEGEISVASREAVFTELKKQGIKPYGVSLAPGFGNWVASLGKRVYLIVVLTTLLVASVVVLVAQREKVKEVEAALAPKQQERRSQIYGDPLLLQQCEAKGWSNIFPDALDQILARYAIPAKAVSIADVRKLIPSVATPLKLAELEIAEDDGAEIAKMKRMVNWMKGELSAYLQAGGTFESYCERLQQRQIEEMRVRARIATELNRMERGAGFEAEWEAKNEILRTMGILPIPMEDRNLQNSPLTATTEK